MCGPLFVAVGPILICFFLFSRQVALPNRDLSLRRQNALERPAKIPFPIIFLKIIQRLDFF